MTETVYVRISTQNTACSQRQINTCHTERERETETETETETEMEKQRDRERI